MTWRWPRFKRSLTGRAIGTLLLAFLLVWVVLVWQDWQTFHRDTTRLGPLQDATQTLVDVLPPDTAGALIVMRASELQYNALRQRAQAQNGGAPLGDLILLLSRVSDGTEVYASAARQGRSVPPQTQPAMEVQVGTQAYWSVHATRGAWRVRFLEPVVSQRTALQMFAANLLVPMLTALPLVLLPLGWAVWRGLQPLRTLVGRVTARRADDFAPLALDLRYAELQPLVAAFNTLLAQAQQAVARERGFVQDAAHELRTPLAVISAQAHALAQAPAHSAEQRDALHHLERAITRASHQVHQLLTLARLDGATTRSPATLDVTELLREALISAAPRALVRRIELSLDAPPEPLRAQLDAVALHSIIDNLLGNALTHVHEGAQVAVTLRADAARHRLHLSVADNGPGLAPDEQARLFERFHRGRHATHPGSGLGLAIVRQAAHTLGGEVVCGPGLHGRGVAFEVTLGPPQAPPV